MHATATVVSGAGGTDPVTAGTASASSQNGFHQDSKHILNTSLSTISINSEMDAIMDTNDMNASFDSTLMSPNHSYMSSTPAIKPSIPATTPSSASTSSQPKYHHHIKTEPVEEDLSQKSYQSSQSSSPASSSLSQTKSTGGPAATAISPKDSANKKRTYHCEICDKKYATMTNIYKHMRSHNLYLCSLCMTTFQQESDIKEHKCPQANAKRPQCTVCFKYLSNSWSLTRHMKIHLNETTG